MTETVYIQGQAKSTDEFFAKDIVFKNASSEATLLRVLKELEKHSKSLGIQAEQAAAEQGAGEEIQDAHVRDFNLAQQKQAEVAKLNAEIHEDLYERYGRVGQAIVDTMGLEYASRLRTLDDIKLALAAETDINQRKKLQALKELVEHQQAYDSLNEGEKKIVDFINNLPIPKFFKDMSARFLSRLGTFSLSPAGIMNFLTTLFPPQFTAIMATMGAPIIALTRILSHWNKVMYTTAEQGGSFNNNLMEMRTAAAKSAMSLDEFASMMKKHSTIFAQYGLTVTAGAKIFANLSNNVLKKYGNELNAMGISMAQINESLPLFLDMTRAGAQGSDLKQSTAEQAASFKRLMVETDLMSKITGKSRQSIMEETQKKMNDTAFQLKMSKMSSAEREKVTATMLRMQAQFGDVGGELVKLKVLGLPPLTESARMATAALGGAVNEINGAAISAMDTSVSAIAHQQKLDDASIKAMSSALKSSQGMEAVISAGAMGLGGSTESLAKIFDQMALQGIKFKNKDGSINEAAIRQAYTNAREEQKARDKVKNGLDEMSNAWREFVDVWYSKVMAPLYKVLAPALSVTATILGSIIGALGGLFEFLSPVFATLGLIGDAVSELFTSISGGSDVVRKAWDSWLGPLTVGIGIILLFTGGLKAAALALLTFGKGLLSRIPGFGGGAGGKVASGIGTISDKVGGGLAKGTGGILSSLADGLTKLGTPKVLLGVLALSGIAAGLWIAGAAIKQFIGLKWEDLAKAGVTLAALVGGVALLGLVGPVALIGAAALGVVSLALMATAAAMEMAADPIDKILTSLQKVNGIAMNQLMLMGPALMSMSVGMMAMTSGGLISSLVDGLGSLFGAKSPFEKLADLGKASGGIISIASSLTLIRDALNSMPSGERLDGIIKSLNSVDASKLSALASIRGSDMKGSETSTEAITALKTAIDRLIEIQASNITSNKNEETRGTEPKNTDHMAKMSSSLEELVSLTRDIKSIDEDILGATG